MRDQLLKVRARMAAAGAMTLHKVGGTDSRPWLAVDPAELEAAYRA
jgi:hypothetical protein